MSPRILFIADAGPQIGGGHVMRSLTLARALAERGATPIFLATPAVETVLDAFGPEVARIPAAPEGLVGLDFDAAVFDHYGLGRDDHQALALGRPVLVIDDLADRPLGADLILDSGLSRTAADYAALAPDAQLLLGPAFAPVRPEFTALREAALARRGEPAARALIALGLTDVGGVTSKVLERMRRRDGGLALDVVLGGGAPSLAGLKRVAAHDQRLSLHVDTPDMAQLIAQADIGIGAAGSTTWERCVLGLPSLLIVLAPNQAMTAKAMEGRGAALVVHADAPDFDSAFDRALVRLLTDASLRADLSAASAQICDGLGAGRVADAFLSRIKG